MLRQFILPDEDECYLNSLDLTWETISDQGMQWVIIYGYPVPWGYNVEKVDVAIKIETGYPQSALDMAYFHPTLRRLDGKGINATIIQVISGKQFQRWSRHRTPQNPWRPGEDNLSTHLSLVSFWFNQEFLKQPNGITLQNVG